MEELEQRVLRAKTRRGEMDGLLEEYLPLIKATIQPYTAGGNYDDLLSVGMLAFVNAVAQYTPGRGGFAAFARACVRSRVLDDVRKHSRDAARVVPLHPGEGEYSPAEAELAMAQYSREAERQALAEEIAALRQELLAYGVEFAELAHAGPRQKRSQRLCRAAAGLLLQEPPLRDAFFGSRRLPQTQLAQRLGVSAKTIENHRRYIVMLAVLLRGDYPAIRSFIPTSGEVG